MAAKKIPLQRVGLFCCPWQNKLIDAFGDMSLTSLNLTNITGITDDHLLSMSKKLNQLTDLCLKYNNDITINGVINFVRGVHQLTTIQLCLKKMLINLDVYNQLLDIVKGRSEKCKLTISLWGLKNTVTVKTVTLKKNIDFLEVISEEDELNSNTEFDYYCGGDGIGGDGGYDLVTFTPNCNTS